MYSDATAISNFLQRDLTAYENSALTDILGGIKIWLDKRLGSTFGEVSATTRYYDGGVINLDIDPCTAVTEVKSINDDETSSYVYTEGTEYILEPQNETVKREIRKRLSPFPRGIARVAVTAKFSEYDGAVPADIKMLVTRLAAGVINSGKTASSGGNVASESLEGHSVTYSTDDANFEGLAQNDATVASILASREELLVDNYDRHNNSSANYEDEGGLLL